MKNYIFFCAILLGLSGMLNSCESLETEPVDSVAPEIYYNTAKDIEYALTGIYDILGNDNLYGGGNGLTTVFDCADEMYFRTGSSRGPYTYKHTSADSWPTNIWQALYKGIERANMLLENIDKSDAPEETKSRIRGEAKFLRAFFYFILVQNYGDVPLKTASTTSANDIFIARTPANDVYQFIYDEMVAAESMVDSITVYSYAGRVTKSAADGILARVCLFWAGFPNNRTEKYQNALTWAEKLIQSGLHSLNPDYSQVFINLIQDKYDLNESIWEIEYYTTGITDPYELGGLGNNNGISQNILEYGYATGQYKVQEYFYRGFEDTDVRRDWAIAPYNFKSNSNPPEKVYWRADQIYDRNIGKYRREYELVTDKNKNSNGTNFPLLRYSDVLLMAAEAENEVHGPTAKAYDWLNEVRERANASIIDETLDKNGFRKLIQDERSRELCFEAQRRVDLIRWGIFVQTMKELADYIEATAPTAAIKTNAAAGAKNVSDIHIYFPIPSRELSLNKLLTQNPGW